MRSSVPLHTANIDLEKKTRKHSTVMGSRYFNNIAFAKKEYRSDGLGSGAPRHAENVSRKTCYEYQYLLSLHASDLANCRSCVRSVHSRCSCCPGRTHDSQCQPRAVFAPRTGALEFFGARARVSLLFSIDKGKGCDTRYLAVQWRIGCDLFKRW